MKTPRARAASAVVLAAVAVLALSASAFAKEISCGADEISVPDERDGGGNLCLAKAEWEKAKAICGSNAEPGQDSDPMGCVCQDGETVGTCGD